MASESSKADQIVHEILEDKKEVDDIKMDGEENTATYSAIIIPEEKPVSEALEKIDVDSSSPATIDVNVKDLQDETGIPEEQKRESYVVLPDVSETFIENDDLNAPPTSTEVSVSEKQEIITETKELSSNGATVDSAGEIVQSSGDAEAVQKKEESLEEMTENPVETLEAKTEVDRNSSDLNAAEANSPRDFTIVEKLPEQASEKNKNEGSNDFETPESAAEAVKGIGSTEMVEQIVQIPDNEKEKTCIEETAQIATDESEQRELGAEKEKNQKSNDVDPIASSDAADTKPIKESNKRESNNFFSKAKRSIVKAKKAILGKLPGPKTGSSEIK